MDLTGNSSAHQLPALVFNQCNCIRNELPNRIPSIHNVLCFCTVIYVPLLTRCYPVLTKEHQEITFITKVKKKKPSWGVPSLATTVAIKRQESSDGWQKGIRFIIKDLDLAIPALYSNVALSFPNISPDFD